MMGFDMDIKINLSIALMLWAIVCSPVFAEKNNARNLLWQDTQPLLAKNNEADHSLSAYQKARYLTLDLSAMAVQLDNNLLAKGLIDSTGLRVNLPLPDGVFVTVNAVVDTLLPPALSRKFPDIKTFKILPDNSFISGRLDITTNGFHALLQTRQGETIFIDPVSNKQKTLYAAYKKSDQKLTRDKPLSCSANLKDEILGKGLHSLLEKPQGRTAESLLNYRIAIAASGEYTAKHGGTVEGALSAIVTTLNRVNQVFEQDLGIHLSLIENSDALIYTDEYSDPYYEEDEEALLKQNQKNIDRVIGSENYDIGHLFTTSGGGLAAIGSACYQSQKALGFSGVSHSYNDSFDLDFVAHEIGHQFGATHTFNGSDGLCSGDTRTARTAFEPGSGSSIMSYAGYCGQDNLQTNTDAMFHIGSIQQIREYVTRGKGNRCGTYNNIQNTAPMVNAGNNYVIPAQTPFELKGSATDLDGDELVYTWQQIDAGERSPENFDAGDNALFRLHLPSSSNERSFPPILDIITHSANRGENLPIQQRDMTFRLVVQDGYNTTQSDNMSVQVERTGSRFALNMPRAQYTMGDTHTVLWNVADTNMPPINCNSVDVSLSVDGGYSFTRNLGQSLPNTGRALVTIPTNLDTTSRGRFKIKCSDNIFFAVSYRNFVLSKQAHPDRMILMDEDQPESGLQDKSLDQNSAAYNTSIATSTKAGGSFGWLSFFLLFIFVGRNKELF